MPKDVRAYIDLMSTDEAGGRTITLVVEYDGKVARLNLGLSAFQKDEGSMAALVKGEVARLIDALEAVDASVEGILESKPRGPDVQTETSGASA